MSTFKHGDFLQDVSAESSGQAHLRFVRCPICYEDLRDESMYDMEDHLAEHDPDELGLTEPATPGRDLRPNPYKIGKDEILAAMGCETHDINYVPVVVEQKELIEAVSDCGGVVTYRAASAILDLSRSAATRRVKKLARAGWLEEIEPGEHRRRRYRLIGTEGGDR